MNKMSPLEYMSRKLAVPKLCGCGCGKPLEEPGHLGPFFKEVAAGRVQVNFECLAEPEYFEPDTEEISANGDFVAFRQGICEPAEA